MRTKARVRGPNFTQNDSALLCQIIEKYKNVIENKRTDSASLLQKQEAWSRVEEEFNALTPNYYRTVESLHQNYKNLKKKLKKDASKMEISVDMTSAIQSIEEYDTSSEGWEKADCSRVSQDTCKESSEVKDQDKSIKKEITNSGDEGLSRKYNEDDPLSEKLGVGVVGASTESGDTISNNCNKEFENIPHTEQNVTNESVIQQTQVKVEYLDTDEHPSGVSTSFAETPRTPNVSQSQNNQFLHFANTRANFRRKAHELLTRKRKLDSPVVLDKHKIKIISNEKMECILLQKQLLQVELAEAKEKMEHNRLLRAMEIEDTKLKYEHNKKLRQIEIEKLKETK